ncbi:MAG: hypothetical protein IKC92_00955, partial [Tidjanibacter sp.]|nr:hypothetical protein [Tidjanibacter sp.]
MKHLLISILTITIATSLTAQERTVVKENRSDWRTEFVTYLSREAALAQKPDGERFYMDLTEKMVEVKRGESTFYVIDEVDVPMIWRDRDIYLHTEGSRNGHRIYVNTKYAGAARDNRVTSEHNITEHITDGVNNFVVEVIDDTAKPADRTPDNRAKVERVWLHAQPRLSIYDIRVS